MLLPGKLEYSIGHANIGHYIDAKYDTAEPYLVWKISADLVEFIVSGGEFFLYTNVIKATDGDYLIIVSCVEDDPHQPYFIQTPLDKKDRTLWRQVLTNGSASIYFLDIASRPLSIGRADFSNVNADFAQNMMRQNYLEPGDPQRQVELVAVATQILPHVERTLPKLRMSITLNQQVGNLVVLSLGDIGISGTEKNMLGLAPRQLGLPNNGELLENDVADMLRKLFPAEQIFINPHHFHGSNREICDVFVVGAQHVLIIQVKKKKHKAVKSAEESKLNASRNERLASEAWDQLLGAYKHLRDEDCFCIQIAEGAINQAQFLSLKVLGDAGALPYDVLTDHIKVCLNGRKIVPLIVLSEMHPTSFESISPKFADWSNKIQSPVVVWGYDNLADLVKASDDEANFFETFVKYGDECMRSGKLVNARFVNSANHLRT